MAAVCWSSLPSDLVGRIADCFVTTNDIDCYMDLRAVCRHWRCVTDDPRDTSDPRFWPRQWIVINMKDYGKAPLLLLNTATGRFLRRDMMAGLLCSHLVIGVAAGGFLVMAERISPGPGSGLRVLNPLTGHSIRFKASKPINILFANVAAVLGSSPTLVLCDGSGKLYRANPESECFAMYEVRMNFPAWRAIASGIYDDVTMKALAFPDDHPVMTPRGYCPFLVESAGQKLAIAMRKHRVEVFSFKIDGADGNNNNKLVGPLKSIGGRAIIVDACRCFSVDANKFSGTIEADCIYYKGDRLAGRDHHIYMYDMKKEKEERVMAVPVVTEPRPPISIIQLLCGYTFDTQILTHV